MYSSLNTFIILCIGLIIILIIFWTNNSKNKLSNSFTSNNLLRDMNNLSFRISNEYLTKHLTEEQWLKYIDCSQQCITNQSSEENVLFGNGYCNGCCFGGSLLNSNELINICITY